MILALSSFYTIIVIVITIVVFLPILNHHLISLVNFYDDLYYMHWRKLIPLRIFL